MKKFSPLVVMLLALSLTLHAKDKRPLGYIDPSTVDVEALLPAPPADGSSATQAEVGVLLQIQRTRTPEEVARAQSEAHPEISLFSGVLGSWFTTKNLPLTSLLLNKVGNDTYNVSEMAKNIWARPRPSLQDSRIHPVIEVPKSFAYPSGHATWATVNALVLAQLAPNLKAKLLARGRQIGEDREIAGVHFPSDVSAGETLGKDLFKQLMANPEFRADLNRAKPEFSAARPKTSR